MNIRVKSTDGMFGFEDRKFLKRLAKSLAEESEKPYSTVRGFINARMSIAQVRATNRCIRGSRIPASNMSNRFRWEGGAALELLKVIMSSRLHMSSNSLTKRIIRM